MVHTSVLSHITPYQLTLYDPGPYHRHIAITCAKNISQWSTRSWRFINILHQEGGHHATKEQYNTPEGSLRPPTYKGAALARGSLASIRQSSGWLPLFFRVAPLYELPTLPLANLQAILP
ncbi:hypothetical protein BC936DRAFT_148277 [Jimgerdemannia flammicorona]|uniref:Uncharacterized protein n=1 Tax=Jimgerdemannia flammicorona TaxID=994334 RepID=A0A433D3C6_9FUNG|nr:hypothetical protein BC936DRAFT_148277 [Jimgerdemannia flammicorona]